MAGLEISERIRIKSFVPLEENTSNTAKMLPIATELPLLLAQG
jgi:hypothetical protein